MRMTCKKDNNILIGISTPLDIRSFKIESEDIGTINSVSIEQAR